MKIALRLAAGCAILFGVLWPTAAVSDEAALKRTAPDECIAWFSWSGLDALKVRSPDSQNRTEQLLADEEVRAFLDSLAKGVKMMSQPGDEEEARLMMKIYETATQRPAVAFLSKIALEKLPVPPKASEPATAPPSSAVIVPTTKVTVGPDGLERIGVDFDVQVTAGDAPRQHGAMTTPTQELTGRTRTVIEDGKKRCEIEVIDAGGKKKWETIGVDFSFDIDDNRQCNEHVQCGLLETAQDLPLVGAYVRAVGTAIWVAQHPSATPEVAIAGNVTTAAPPAPVCTTCEGCTTCAPPPESIPTKTVYEGAVVIDVGPNLADMKAVLTKIEENQKLPRETIGGVEFVKIDLDQTIWLAFHEAYVVFAFDKASADQVIRGLSGKRDVPKWLVDAEAKLPVERAAARMHFNIDGITKLIDEPFEEPSQELVKSLGLDQVSAISFVAGLDDRGTAIKTLIATRDGGNVSAVLDFFGNKGITADDLKVIPKDSTFAAVGKMDIEKLFNLYIKFSTIDEKDGATAWEETKKYLSEQLFIDFSKDILASLGDTWTIHSSPSEGGLMATTFTLSLRDEAKFKSVIEKLAILANSGEKVIRRFTYRGQEVYYVNQPESGIMVSLCIKDGRLVASMLPQTIKAHIARGPVKESLADVAGVKKVVGDSQKVTAISVESAEPVTKSDLYVLTYTDTPAILRWCYQYGSFLLPTIGEGLSEMAKDEGSPLALHDIPSLAVIEQYFEPSITTFSRTDAGLLIDSRQTVPMFSGLFGLSAASSVGGIALDGADLSNAMDMAGSLVGMPIEIVGGMSGGGCSNGTCGTLPSPYWMKDDVQYFAPSTDTPPPLPPGAQPVPHGAPVPGGPIYGQPVFSQPVPTGTPVPYAPSVPGQAYPAPPAAAPVAPTVPPTYSNTGAPPVAMPQVNSGYAPPASAKPIAAPSYSAPAYPATGYAVPAGSTPGSTPGPNVPLSVPAGLADKVIAAPVAPAVPAAPAPPAVLENVPAGRLWKAPPVLIPPPVTQPSATAPATYNAPVKVGSATLNPAPVAGPGPSILSSPKDSPASQTPVPIGPSALPKPKVAKEASAPNSASPKQTNQPQRGRRGRR